MTANLNPTAGVAARKKAQKVAAPADAKAIRTQHTTAKARDKKPPSKTSKQDFVIAMLQRKEGASVTAIMKATGWQKHSVHGFFAGVVRKKLQLNLVRASEGENAIYRVTASKASESATTRGKNISARKPSKIGRKPAGKPSR